MKTFEIPICWTMRATVTIQAESLEEAEEKASNDFYGSTDSKGEYVQDSFQIDN